MLHNISEGGIYMRVARCVEVGSEVVVLIDLLPRLEDRVEGPRVSARGKVLRVEPKPLSTCDVAVQFSSHLRLGNIKGE
jgi:Tfp pilus assembly protein PilZ